MGRIDIATAERADLHAALPDLARRFREDSGQYTHWPADRCATHLADLAGRAGRLVNPAIRNSRRAWTGIPDWLLANPSAFPGDPRMEDSHALWWLAFVGWLEISQRIAAVTSRGVAYHCEVFRHWRPNMPFYKHPYLIFHPGLCKAYGVAACLQSAVGVETVLEVARSCAPRVC